MKEPRVTAVNPKPPTVLSLYNYACECLKLGDFRVLTFAEENPLRQPQNRVNFAKRIRSIAIFLVAYVNIYKYSSQFRLSPLLSVSILQNSTDFFSLL